MANCKICGRMMLAGPVMHVKCLERVHAGSPRDADGRPVVPAVREKVGVA